MLLLLLCGLCFVLLYPSGPPMVQAAFDYCAASKDLCQPPSARHVVCNGRSFGSVCREPKLIKMNDRYRKQILEFHNRLRNNIACGYFRRYAEASSMEQLVGNNTDTSRCTGRQRSPILPTPPRTGLGSQAGTYGRVQRPNVHLCPRRVP
uniref:Putative salivary antigen 5 family protein 2 n=1 Tax=Anopheles braziliensis TaxID=58242 RepID=A0A2M3ZM71_9DIPT